MSMRVRLFSRGARWVWRLSDRRWLALHRCGPAWAMIFAETMDMLAIQCDILCRGGRWWTVIEMGLDKFSPKKRQLIAAALLKAARYN